MPTYSGKDIHGKIIKVRPYQAEGDDKLLWLTERQRGLLLAMTEYLDWKTRWETLPSPLDDDNERDAYVSGLKNRLMIVVDFCEEVIKCIGEDSDVRDKLKEFLWEEYGIDDDNPPGQPMDRSESGRNLVEGTNEGCDKDILYAQCRAVIDESHFAAMDVFEKVEVYTNSFEIAKNLWDSIPILGELDNIIGLDGVTDMIAYWQEAIQEEYEAQYTETIGGIRDMLAYKLFCRCKHDCAITVDRILDVYRAELDDYIQPPSLSGLVNFIETIAGVEQDSTFVVVFAHFVCWGLVKLMHFLFGRRFNRQLEVLLKLKADEPSNDWEALEILFGDCPEEILLVPIILEGTWSDIVLPQGTNLEPVEGEPGYWIATSTPYPGGGYAIAIEEESGRPFSISDRSFPDGLVSAIYIATIDGVDTGLSFASAQHDNMTRVVLFMFSGAANARFKFKFFEPAEF